MAHAKVSTTVSTAQIAEDGAATAGLLAAAPPPGRTRGIADLGGRARASSPPCSTLGRPPCQPTRRGAFDRTMDKALYLGKCLWPGPSVFCLGGEKACARLPSRLGRGAYWLRGEVSTGG